MKIKRTLILLLIINSLLLSCKKEENTGKKYEPKFAVEGWIENEGYPHVILTRNVPFFSDLDSAQLANVVLRWAKVTVSDGETSEILTSRKDDNYFPSYIYKGSKIKGEIGKTYTLTIEYLDTLLTSTTMIPKPVPLDSIWFEGKNDTLAQLNIRFQDPPDKNYYKIYTKTSLDKRYIPTLLSNHDDKFFNGKKYTLQINKGAENNLSTKKEPYFKINEEVLVKISTIPKNGFDFWNSFQNEILNSSNPLIGSTGEIMSNIQGPALGVWCGYGSSIYKVKATP